MRSALVCAGVRQLTPMNEIHCEEEKASSTTSRRIALLCAGATSAGLFAAGLHAWNWKQETRVDVVCKALRTGGRTLSDEDTRSIYARVLFGKSADEFHYLSAENHPFPFVMGPEDIAACSGKNEAEILQYIGSTHITQYVQV